MHGGWSVQGGWPRQHGGIWAVWVVSAVRVVCVVRGGGGDLGGVVGLTDWWSVCGVQAEVRLTTGTKLCSCPLVTLWHVP